MTPNTNFTFKNKQGKYITGKIIEVKQDTIIITVLGDLMLHEVPKNYFNNMEIVRAEEKI